MRDWKGIPHLKKKNRKTENSNKGKLLGTLSNMQVLFAPVDKILDNSVPVHNHINGVSQSRCLVRRSANRGSPIDSSNACVSWRKVFQKFTSVKKVWYGFEDGFYISMIC
ncbi:hypothetical protein PIB30_055231 [Stylosanthes scabra]|uniref:Uncharacterized protein n=1 Tax=Stylosanthes scabra TaxID=79078 RepID=A0ABU6UIV9_9FABA|nr:hypothetical protein [Stylosanthes scabra]